MSWNLDAAPPQNGRLAIVTGANAGLGYETALGLARKGCEVIMACRNRVKAEAAKDDLLAKHPTAKVSVMELDLASQKSVQAFAKKFSRKHTRLDLLVNNAGVMMLPFALTEDGFETQLAANYLGHFALTGLLLPTVLATPGSRIVSLSSLAHKWSGIRFDDPHFAKGYSRRLAYGQSKLACLMFAYELQRRLASAGHATLSVAAHPGVSLTNIGQNLPRFLTQFAPLVSQSAADGALPILYAALGDDVQGGDYCGPVWPGEFRGPPGKVGSNKRSRNAADAARLWEMSEKMTGVNFPD